MSPEFAPCRPCGRLLAVLLSTFIMMATPLFADDAGNILNKTGDFYQDHQSLAADVTIDFIMPPQFADMGGMPTLGFRYSFDGPNRFSFLPPNGGMIPPVVQDGKEYYSEMPMMKVAVRREAFDLPDLMKEEGETYLQLPGTNLLIGLGLPAEVPGSLRSLTASELLGEEDIDGVACHHLAVSGDHFKGDIWIAKGKQPWVLRVVQEAPEAKPEESGMMMIQPGLDIKVSGWTLDPDFGDAFVIKTNPDLKVRDTMPSMEEMMAQMGPGGGGPDEPHHTLGQPAPDVTLDLMDGGQVKLSDLKGQVVVLDFWATWCKPCVMALPLVSQVTSDLADQGVVFYAVNQQESADKVKTFLEKKGLQMPVAMDRNAKAGAAFGVTGIPHSVVIDRDGVIRQVHVGFGPGMENQLKAEILELLSH